MRLVNHCGSAVILTPGGPLDVHKQSAGRFGPSLPEIYADWDEFTLWAGGLDATLVAAQEPGDSIPLEELRAPSPEPRQVFAIGLNYYDHAAETGTPVPEQPPVFTKFQTSIDGPLTELRLSGHRVDWEVELVVVIGRRGSEIAEVDAWDHVAGVTVGQDFSDRAVQLAGPVPQFSLGKSFAGYSPMGPALVTPDELQDRDDLEVSCSVNGQLVQKGRTSGMIFSVSQLVARLSMVATLLPGDVIFTGTPAGVGVARSPQRFLAVGDEVVTEIGGIGAIRSRCI